MRRLVVTAAMAAALAAGAASPAAAFLHATVPADECATNSEVTAANNPTAREALFTRGAVHQGAQTAPIGNAQAGRVSEGDAHCAMP